MNTRPCRRPDCGHPRDTHHHYRDGTDCALCACAAYRGQLPPRRLLARWGFSLASGSLTGYLLVLLATGYHGVGLVWGGLAAMVLLAAGSAMTGPGRDGGHRGR